MRTLQHQDNLQSKQRLRSEISNQVEDFLHRGGRIDVVSAGSQQALAGHRPAAADLSMIPSLHED